MIEVLSTQDYDKVVKLGKILHEDFSISNISPYETIIVYKSGEEICGFLQYRKLYETLDIVNIVVDEKYRRQKIGTKLVNYVFDMKDATHFMLEVRSTNENALEFYKHLGFSEIRKIKNYYGIEDAISMERKIV